MSSLGRNQPEGRQVLSNRRRILAKRPPATGRRLPREVVGERIMFTDQQLRRSQTETTGSGLVF